MPSLDTTGCEDSDTCPEGDRKAVRRNDRNTLRKRGGPERLCFYAHSRKDLRRLGSSRMHFILFYINSLFRCNLA